MSIPSTAPKVGHYRWRIIALLFFATTINYIDRQVLGMLKPIITDDIHIPMPWPSWCGAWRDASTRRRAVRWGSA